MSKHVVVVLSEPVEGCEAEFDDWYEKTHIPEVLETTGWTIGQRFKLTAEKGQKCPLQYLAFYEAEAERGDAVVAASMRHLASGNKATVSTGNARGFGSPRKPARNAQEMRSDGALGYL